MQRLGLVALGTGVLAACVGVPVAPRFPDPGFVLPPHVRVQVVERGIAVVRDVPLEDYVRATAVSEFAPATGDLDIVEKMLEVQAIISRTYAVAHIARHTREGFDLCATTHCQIFDPGRVPTSRWSPAASQAVTRTAGVVVWYEEGPAQALFHADCGGRTSAAADVWGGQNLPYLVARADNDVDAEAHRTWQYQVTIEAITDALNADARTRLAGPLGDIHVRDRDGAGRAERVVIRSLASTPAEAVVRGEELRQILTSAFGPRAIRSTLFDVRRTSTTFTFSGRGYGHGVGLCQAGALARLRAGAVPADVIGYYYPGTTLARSGP
jgi:stage II sporulation protein D